MTDDQLEALRSIYSALQEAQRSAMNVAMRGRASENNKLALKESLRHALAKVEEL